MTIQQPFILGISGSLREPSSTAYAVRLALSGAEQAGARALMLSPDELRLPLFDDRDDISTYGPKVEHYLQVIRSAHGIVLGTPVYHGMFSAVLKNALEFLELLAGEDPPRLSGKVVALISVAAGSPNTSGVNALQWACRPLQAWILPKSVATTSAALQSQEGHPTDPHISEQLQTLGRTLVYWTSVMLRGDAEFVS